ncbi:MMPL family transporter [Pelagibius litoralis]|uniref:MMPL family transporter n=1 Tax=Pelagibius litoralis TaxID=374515 RepID=A0A967F226_9PROT|nr:MMPL family transporter [Pelagibius litoralis]NIA71617.1 MMPL family transporter [Pelagibius litoralis]
MSSKMPDSSHDWVSAWVRRVCRRAGLVVSLSLLAAAGLLWFAVTTLSINTSTTDMLSEDLPFRQNNVAVDLAFPQRDDTLILVIEGPDSLAAEQAAARLAATLREQPERFESVFDLEGAAFFRRNGLLFLSQIDLDTQADRLAEAEPLLAALLEDPSLRGLQGLLTNAFTEAEGGGENLGFLLDSLAAVAEALPTQPHARLSWPALLQEQAETDSQKRRFLIVKPRTDFASLTPVAAAVVAIEAAIEVSGFDAAAGYRIRLTGEALMLQDELYSVRSGIGFVGLLSAVLVACVLFIGLRSWRLVLPILVTLVVGLCWTAGFAALAVGQLNLISVAFAVLFIGLSVDFGIHFALRFREVLGAGGSSGEPLHAEPGESGTQAALSLTAALIGRPLLLCGLSSAIAFFAFLPTAYRGLSELGLIAGGGMFIALFANLTLLPALLSLLPLQAAPLQPGPIAAVGAWVHRQAGQRARWLLGLGGLLALASLLALPQAVFDDDPLNLRDPNSPSVATLLDLLSDERVQPYEAEVLAADLPQAVALAARLEALPEVAAAVTLADFVPADQQDKLAVIDEMVLFLSPLFLPGEPLAPPGPDERRKALTALQQTLATAPPPLGDAAGRLLTALRALDGGDNAVLAKLERAWLAGLGPQIDRLGEALEADAVGLEDLPPDLIARYRAADGRALIEVQPRDDLRDAAARARFVDAVQAVVPTVSGPPVTIVAAGRAVIEAFVQASLIALVAIAVLLWLVLRSLRDCLLVLIPLVLAAAMTVAAGVLLDLPFNFANVIVLPLLLGLGVDSGIHSVMRARELRQAGPDGAAGANSTPRAILLSALTTLASFGALGLSSHPGTASMGMLLTLAIVVTLFCILLLLPALLAVTERRGEG